MTVRGGLGFRASRVEHLVEDERVALLLVPLQFDWDTSDDLLDPGRGGRLGLKFAPFFDIFLSDFAFLKGYASYARYVRLLRRPSIVFASRAALGAMTGAARDSIPADLRFYAGGGGSVRGIPFQTAGPLNEADEEPLGGRSLLELSAELRVKVTKTIGFVTFVDGGSAFEAKFPDLEESLRWGAGVGLRYFTPIGPLRLDVALPLNRREDIDDRFQIYVSIGQAF
jgi:translocation and assembly module TamA